VKDNLLWQKNTKGGFFICLFWQNDGVGIALYPDKTQIQKYKTNFGGINNEIQ